MHSESGSKTIVLGTIAILSFAQRMIRFWKVGMWQTPGFCHAGWLQMPIFQPRSLIALARKKSSAK